MHTIYFIPGLGADERLFSRLKLGGYDKKFIQWISPLEKETLPEYAGRLSEQIDIKNIFSLVGVSFGGMIAVELAKIIHPQNLILISSAKTCNEIPGIIRAFRYLPVYRFLSDSFIRWLAKLNKHRFGIFKDEEAHLFAEMMLSCPAGYFQKAIWMITHWKNEEYPALIHIHGDNDSIFPIHKIKGMVVVKGGTHFMPYHNAEEVEKVINEKIQK